jgi:discoidin domain receptor family protein 2
LLTLNQLPTVSSSLVRLNSDTQGGAWCPREPVSREKEDQYLEVNLATTHVITEVLTQGRFANGQGQEYAQAYRIHYWRQGLLEFKEYRDSMGKTVRYTLPPPKNIIIS